MRRSAKSESRTPNPVCLPLLVEIGCEEIPARLLAQAQTNLGGALIDALRRTRLTPYPSEVPSVDIEPLVFSVTNSGLQAGDSWTVFTYSTPRRLVAYAPAVLTRQPDKVEEITGPPVKVAFDAAGKPTRAAESFAEKNGARVADLVRVTTPKGEYLAVKKTTRGRPAMELLSELLPAVATDLSFPKSMYWVKGGPRFVRPLRWIVALLGEGRRARVIPFQIAGVKSGNSTYGQRALHKGVIRVGSFNHYVKKLRQAHVEFDPERRRERVREEIKVLLEDLSLNVVEDKELEDWIVNSTEWPHALLGSFEGRFLKLPREIVITVMRDHQKYLAVEDQKGNLQPRFVTVLNRDGDPKGLIRAGHERVLTARFRDAEFFWDADQKIRLEDRVKLLERVTYHEKLGSYFEKIKRMELISQEVDRLAILPADKSGHLRRAIWLSKGDLTTQMVQEFPELQGVVGGLYAREQGEPQEVWQAIYDHYLPQGFEGQCPETLTGAVVSMIDKFDTVLAGFAAGLEPTGSSDPFALRRHAGGLIKLLLEVELPINLRQLHDLAVGAYGRLGLGGWRSGNELYDAFQNFIGDRLRYYFESLEGIRYDTVRAVMAAGYDVPLDALRRAEALEKIRDASDFEALSIAAKRIKNILAKSASPDDYNVAKFEPALLQPGPERRLFDAWDDVATKVQASRRVGDYIAAFGAMSSLRPAVDDFFDKILVMAEDPNVRRNRLQLLVVLNDLFRAIAHLSEIQERSRAVASNVDASTSGAATSEE